MFSHNWMKALFKVIGYLTVTQSCKKYMRLYLLKIPNENKALISIEKCSKQALYGFCWCAYILRSSVCYGVNSRLKI